MTVHGPSAKELFNGVLRLSIKVAQRRGPNGRIYLTHLTSGRVVQIGGLGSDITKRLADGVQVDQLIAEFERRFPTQTDVRPQIFAFVKQLIDAGMIEGHPGVNRTKVRLIILPFGRRVSRSIAAAAEIFSPGIRLGITVLILAGSVVASVAAVWNGRIMPWQNIKPWTLILAFGLLPIFSFLHELAHAVRSRLAGLSVVEIGLAIKRFKVAPLVQSGPQFMMLPRWDRIAISLAGPACDFSMIGIAAAALIAAPLGGTIASTASVLFLLKALTFTGNLSPFGKSDGSDALQAWFDDYTLRRAAFRRSDQRGGSAQMVLAYRVIAFSYAIFVLGIWIELVRALLGWGRGT